MWLLRCRFVLRIVAFLRKDKTVFNKDKDLQMIANSLCAPTECKSRRSGDISEKTGATDELTGKNEGVDPRVTVDGGKPRNRCCPYDFDSSLCQVINDRVLCGYNRNVGKPERDDVAIGLSDGCRIRGGRLECGYTEGPFNIIRRPPAWNNAAEPNDPTAEVEGKDKLTDSMKSVQNPQKGKLKQVFNVETVTKCVEIKNRIICKGM